MVTGNNTATATDTNAMEIPTTTSILGSTTPAETPLSSMATISGLQDSQVETTSDPDDMVTASIAFVPEACLFCPQLSPNFQANLTHMQKSHGLFIPTSIESGSLSLAVDMETLIGYMHLVIFGYHECLFCGKQRADGWAARQHMMGRGHCRIDISSSESEWRDFYEIGDSLLTEGEGKDVSEDEAEESSHDGGQRGAAHARANGQILPVGDGDSLRLSSGRIIAHRAAPAPKDPLRKPLAKLTRRGDGNLFLEDFISAPHQPSTTTLASSSDGTSSNSEDLPQDAPSTPSPQPQALSRADRRLLGANKSAVTAAVATMSKHDRASLAHLSPAERRAMVVTQFKYQDRVHIAKRKYWSKFERRQDIPAEGGKVYIGGG